MKHILLLLVMLLLACNAQEDPSGSPVTLPGTDLSNTGVQGPQGPPGTPGLTVSSSLSCSALTSGILFRYEVVVYSTGDVLSICSVGGTAIQASNVFWYRSTTVGALNGRCSLTYDADSTASAGWWEFKVGSSPSVTYHDTGSTADGLTLVFQTSDCISN